MVDYPDSFADYPVQLNEVVLQDCGGWTPREVLIAMLREIDSGEVAPYALMVAYSAANENGTTSTGLKASAPDGPSMLGTLELAKLKFLGVME